MTVCGIVVISVLIVIVFAFIFMRGYFLSKEHMVDQLISRSNRSLDAVQNDFYDRGENLQRMCLGTTCMNEDDMKHIMQQAKTPKSQSKIALKSIKNSSDLSQLCLDGGCLIGDFGGGSNRLHISSGDLVLLPKRGTFITADWGADPTVNMISGAGKTAKLCIDGECLTKDAIIKLKSL